MRYTATGGNRHLEIVDELQQPAGVLSYSGWLVNTARISLAGGGHYEITAKGFWNRSKLVAKEGVAYAELKAGGIGRVRLLFANGRQLQFKRKSLWTGSYMLLDELGMEIADISSRFHWRSFSYSYDIAVMPNGLDREINMLLPFLLVYGLRYIRMRQAAAAS